MLPVPYGPKTVRAESPHQPGHRNIAHYVQHHNLTSESMHTTDVACRSPQLPGSGLDAMRTWPAVARQLPLRLDRPQEHNELSALSQSAAKVGAVADGEPDDASRGQAASCRTDARSAVIAAATVHGMQARGWAAHGLSQSCTP